MRRFRPLLLGIAAFAAVAGLALWWFTRDETGTRLVCRDGQVCTESFSFKDGLPVRAVCPSTGGEQYGLPDGCTRLGSTCRCGR
jgi:hypothetical protein